MTLHLHDGVTVMNLGEMEIWDGADLALLRETLTRQIEGERCRAIGVDMGAVKYIPSGFFGMLYDWHDKGVAIHLYRPQHNVQNMLWFRRFFALTSDNRHTLTSDAVPPLSTEAADKWVNGSHGDSHNGSTNGAADGHTWLTAPTERSMTAAGRG